MGLQISQSSNGQNQQIYADAQGSTRLVTDDSGQIIEVLDFDAFGNERHANPQESRHRYTGEAFDSTTGLYHLRARDYDPKTGRFISMNEHPGSQTIPLTLNKYLYGNADPVNHIDPSGNFSLGGMMSGIGNMASMMTMSWIRMEVADMFSSALLSPVIEAMAPEGGMALVMPKGNLYMNLLFEALATHCVASKKKCYIRKVPLLSHGINLVGHATHIWASLHGFGNTLSGAGYTSAFLVRGTPYKRGWYNKYYPCNQGVKGDKLSCDEYPFASTLNGGYANYLNDSVSLRLLPHHESDRQKTLLNKFYGQADVSIGKPFISIANPLFPSYFIDKRGVKHNIF